VTGSVTLRCRGNWSSDPAFVPTSGTITFEGTGNQTIAGTGLVFRNLTIQAGSTTTTALPNLQIIGSLTVNGTFRTTGVLDMDGNCTVSTTGTLDLGTVGHTFGGSFTMNGALLATATLLLDGSGSLSSAVPLPPVRIAASGNYFAAVDCHEIDAAIGRLHLMG
jgi:hypothetical protein